MSIEEIRNFVRALRAGLPVYDCPLALRDVSPAIDSALLAFQVLPNTQHRIALGNACIRYIKASHEVKS